MANELLDFVISLVRDPDAAARYAADPAAALAGAHLTGVTSADVDNLRPLVSDSLTPAAGAGWGDAGAGGTHWDSGVWTSGAATAALDAFSPHPSVIHDPAPLGVDPAPALDPAPVDDHDYSALPQVVDDMPTSSTVDEHPVWDGFEHPAVPTHEDPPQHHGGFDFLH